MTQCYKRINQLVKRLKKTLDIICLSAKVTTDDIICLREASEETLLNNNKRG